MEPLERRRRSDARRRRAGDVCFAAERSALSASTVPSRKRSSQDDQLTSGRRRVLPLCPRGRSCAVSSGVCARVVAGPSHLTQNLNVVGFRRWKWPRLWSTSFPPTIRVVDQCIEVGTTCSHCRPTGAVVVCGSSRDQPPPPIQHPPPIQQPPPIRRADRRNAPKGAQRARRLADAREESNTARGKQHGFDMATRGKIK